MLLPHTLPISRINRSRCTCTGKPADTQERCQQIGCCRHNNLEQVGVYVTPPPPLLINSMSVSQSTQRCTAVTFMPLLFLCLAACTTWCKSRPFDRLLQN